ncbi:MAG: DUF1877 family protein [Cyclobacteriaceae bacterium]
MSVTCTYYRIGEKWIDLLSQLPEEADNWIEQLSDWIEGDNVENRIYGLDSAWDVAQFLLNECDTSAEKILKKVIKEAHFFETGAHKTSSPRYLKTDEVQAICRELQKISEDELSAKWDQQKMINNRVYKIKFFTKQEDWKYIMEHIIPLIKHSMRLLKILRH